jgi:phosphoesterase RecJ-like protein
MTIEADGRLAVLAFDEDLLEALGASYDDTEGLINVPLSARTIEAVALLKGQRGTSDVRVSLRSKGAIDVRDVARRFGGGGHVNAAGCTVAGPMDAARAAIVEAVAAALGRPGRAGS